MEVDAHGPSHEQYTEDCPVCCRPWDVRVTRGDPEEDGLGLDVELRRDDD